MKYWIHFSTNVLILKFSISESPALTLLSEVPFLFGLTTGVGPTNSAQVTTRQHKLEKIGKPGSRINWRLSMCILQSRFTSKQASLAGIKTIDKWILSYLESTWLPVIPRMEHVTFGRSSSTYHHYHHHHDHHVRVVMEQVLRLSGRIRKLPHTHAVNGQVDVGG